MSSQFAHWPPTSDQSPPYVSDLDGSTRPLDHPDILIHKASVGTVTHHPTSDSGSYTSLHQHRDSISTSATDSTGSSPTTTASLLDSQSIGETPGQSPDTPASAQSLGYLALGPVIHSTSPPDFHLANLADPNRPLAPAKKARNLKNLAVNTQGTIGAGRAPNTATLPLQPAPEAMAAHLVPATPGFVKPVTPRRKSSGLGLTITTNATSLPLRREAVPPTPSLVRPATLRHFQSSPSLNLLTSKGAPEGGMRLPPISTRNTIAVGFADVPLELDEEDEQNFDVPQSREDKPQAYPDGPICIYDPHVYLYREPNADQASTYDVIFNVASEVPNPLSLPAKDLIAAEADTRSITGVAASSPITPKATDTTELTTTAHQPEYIHIPWEHNTDIVPDLYRLVKVIDERVQQGKKVLIHCQCGVSRSASLIVAYGLYKNPTITVQEAYDAVKRRSKWIGPNMSLIMQLQEFRSGLLRTSAGVTKPVSNTSLGRPSFNRSQSAQGEHFVRSHSRMPMSAPLPPEITHPKPDPISTAATEYNRLDQGPSSAPSGLRWPVEPDSPRNTATTQEVPLAPDEKLSQPHAVRIDPPRLQMQLPPASPESIVSPRSIDFAMSSALPSANLDDSFGLTSPRATNFGASTDAPAGWLATLPATRANQNKITEHFTPPQDSLQSAGLTSPREASFGSHATLLPLRPLTTSRVTLGEPLRVKPILPSMDTSKATAIMDSEARAELGARMGMSRRSNYDLRAAFLSGTSKDAKEIPDLPPVPTNQARKAPKLKTAPSLPDFAEALMSPRAEEFTNNPFREPGPRADAPLGKQGAVREISQNTLKAGQPDPRSPPQKGASPIIRNIFDVL